MVKAERRVMDKAKLEIKKERKPCQRNRSGLF
jgi:hypothetical protein